MNKTKEIAFAFPRYDHYERLISGVLQYVLEHDCRWSYITPAESLAFSVLNLEGWSGDGVLAEIRSEKEERCARKLPMPVVNIACMLSSTDVPQMLVDNAAFGDLAADHLLEKGFPSFAFYGVKDVEFSKRRRDGFINRLASKGYPCACLEVAPTYGLQGTGWHSQHHELAKWIKGLSTPCGLFANSDYRARHVLDVCKQNEIAVPKQIGIIGVDDLTVICEHSDPTLTSIARNDLLQGYRAAELLDQQIRGERIPDEHDHIPPLGVVERGSTACIVSDPRLLEVRNYLLENLSGNISIKTICRDVGISRRWLEYQFRVVFGESPHRYLRSKRLSLARKLLVEEPGEKIESIAIRSGFSSGKQLYAAFLKEFNMSPREYRRTTSPYRTT